jgi:DNA polymerase-4
MPAEVPWIAHLDVDAFFAAIEQRDDPSLRGRPVAVGTGVVASCSPEAKRLGVQTAMRLSDARRICPRLVILPGDYRRYELAGRQILGICREVTPRVETPALDDLYLDLTATAGRANDPAKFAEHAAHQLRRAIHDEVRLSVSLGVGSSKLAARVATHHAKRRHHPDDGRRIDAGTFTRPDPGIVRVLPGREAGYLSPWPVRVLHGLGPKMEERLDRVNVHLVGELAALPMNVACAMLGHRAKVLRDQARGIDPRPVEPAKPSQSLSRCTSFDPPSSEPEFLLAMLENLLERALSWLRRHDLGTRSLAVVLRYGDYRSDEVRTTFPSATRDEITLHAAARDRFERLYRRRLPLRLLGVNLGPLQVPLRQRDLFDTPAEERRERLEECKDAIRERFGFLSLQRGSTVVLNDQLEHDRDNYHLRTPCLTR